MLIWWVCIPLNVGVFSSVIRQFKKPQKYFWNCFTGNVVSHCARRPLCSLITTHCQNHQIASRCPRLAAKRRCEKSPEPVNDQTFCTEKCEKRFQKQEEKIKEQAANMKKLEEKMKKQEKRNIIYQCGTPAWARRELAKSAKLNLEVFDRLECNCCTCNH